MTHMHAMLRFGGFRILQNESGLIVLLITLSQSYGHVNMLHELEAK